MSAREATFSALAASKQPREPELEPHLEVALKPSPARDSHCCLVIRRDGLNCNVIVHWVPVVVKLLHTNAGGCEVQRNQAATIGANDLGLTTMVSW